MASAGRKTTQQETSTLVNWFYVSNAGDALRNPEGW